MRKIKLSEIVAYNNPKDAVKIIHSFGYIPAKTQQELASQLDKLIVIHQGYILKMLADAHPHRDLIISSLKEDMKSNVEGEQPVIIEPKAVEVETKKNDQWVKYVAVIGIGVVVGAILFKS